MEVRRESHKATSTGLRSADFPPSPSPRPPRILLFLRFLAFSPLVHFSCTGFRFTLFQVHDSVLTQRCPHGFASARPRYLVPDASSAFTSAFRTRLRRSNNAANNTARITFRYSATLDACVWTCSTGLHSAHHGYSRLLGPKARRRQQRTR